MNEMMADQYTCILSKNVMTGKGPTPLHALVVCNSETGKIHQIIELDSKKKDFNSMIEGYKKKYKVVDVGNHFVLPGAIDSYCHLNSDYHESWAYVKESIRTAAASGVTTLIDYPMMRLNNLEAKEEVSLVRTRMRVLEHSKLYTDIALMAHLKNYSLDELKEIANAGVVGFCAHLMPTFEPKLPYLSKEDFSEMVQKINSLKENLALAVYCDMGTGRELAISSPYRTQSIESRLAHGINIDLSMTKDAYADGDVDSLLKAAAEEVISLKSDNDSDSLEEIKGTDNALFDSPKMKRSKKAIHLTPYKIDRIQSLDKNCSTPKSENIEIEAKTPNSSALKKFAIRSSRRDALRNLAGLEIMSYTSCESRSFSSKFSVWDVHIDEIDSPCFPVDNEGHEAGFQSEESTSPLLDSPNSFDFKVKKRVQSGETLGTNDNSPIKDSQFGKRLKMSHDYSQGGLHPQKKVRKDVAKSGLRKLKSSKKLKKVKIKLDNSYEEKKKQNPSIEKRRRPPQPKPKLKVMKMKSPPIPLKIMNPKISMKLQASKKKQSTLLQRRKKFKMNLKINTDKKGHNSSKNQIESCRYKYSFYGANRPIIWQKNAVTVVVDVMNKLTSKPKFKVVLLNVSSASVISLIRDYNKNKNSRRIGVCVLTPHLMFHSGKIGEGMTQFKFGQPIRDRENRRHLINHHQIKSISMVSSGHLYVPRQFKKIDGGCFLKSFNGYCSVGFNIHTIWTNLVLMKVKARMKADRKMTFKFTEKEIRSLFRNFDEEIDKLVRVCSRKPAVMFNLESKGTIEVGKDADLVVWDPFKSRAKKIDLTIRDKHLFKESQLLGSVEMTFLGGACIYSRKKELTSKVLSRGKILTRQTL